MESGVGLKAGEQDDSPVSRLSSQRVLPFEPQGEQAGYALLWRVSDRGGGFAL
jgi:hypothetical protein